MFKTILTLDKKIIIYLNNLGASQYDLFWEMITKQSYWLPLFAFLMYLIFKTFGWRHLLLIIVFIALLVTINDQVTNLFKYGIKRLRPIHDPEIKDLIRHVISGGRYSFFSAHAANSMAITVFLFLVLKPYYKHMALLFLWPLLFSYSRIYLGLHYPLDILCGFVCGFITALLGYRLYKKCREKYHSVLQ